MGRENCGSCVIQCAWRTQPAVVPTWALVWAGVRVANSPIGGRSGFAERMGILAHSRLNVADKFNLVRPVGTRKCFPRVQARTLLEAVDAMSAQKGGHFEHMTSHHREPPRPTLALFPMR